MSRKCRAAGKRNPRQNSFTLVELLVVMGIIAILAALTLGAASGVMNHAARSRAASEIAAMRTALDSYKVDNGGYPVSDGILLTNNYADSDGTGTTGTEYQTNSQILYQALSGKTNFSDTTVGKSYMNFKNNQVGSAATGSYVMDPWGYSYGYSTGSTNGATTVATPYTGANSYDLWSTGGMTYAKWTAAPATTTILLTNAWINNWQ